MLHRGTIKKQACNKTNKCNNISRALKRVKKWPVYSTATALLTDEIKLAEHLNVKLAGESPYCAQHS